MVLTLSDQMIERFWSLVDRRGGPDACWLWTGPTRSRGQDGSIPAPGSWIPIGSPLI
jgi:hypothetical protein